MNKLMTTLAAGLMAVVFLANSVKADDDDTPKLPPKPAPKAAPGALTDESLGVMLEQMGFEVKTSKTSSGDPYYTIEIEHNGWTLPYTVELSPNKKWVWISISIFTLSEGQEPPADIFTLTRTPEAAPDRPVELVVGF